MILGGVHYYLLDHMGIDVNNGRTVYDHPDY